MSKQPQKRYPRFTLSQQIQHWVLTASFTILGVTGLPQMFVGAAWAETMIDLMGGIELVRIIHRVSAVVLMVLTVYHIAEVAYKVFVQRVALTMNPGLQDLKDMLGVISYNIGLSKDRPKLPRYNFEEKMEYWAVVWGTVIMAITGFMLWNPIATTELLPGSFIPAAKAAHGGEAVLAILAIVIWHFYGVHIRRLNRSMFKGTLSREAMEHEHGLELEQIETGTLPPSAPPEEEARRARVFIPVALLISIVMLIGIYIFVTFEDTAIETVVAAEERPENAFQPISFELGRPSLHATIQEYNGPQTCAASGCHTGEPLETAEASEHSQLVAVGGPNPLLAKTILADASQAEETLPDCLVCHAQEYNPDDLVASAQTVRAAGGDTCLRCHSYHPEDDLHADVGMACVSCHTAINHEIELEVACTNCHADDPHPDNPFLNTKHDRLDCRTCHVGQAGAILVDAGNPVLDPDTGFYRPTIEQQSEPLGYAWYTPDGQEADINTEGAMIVPTLSLTIRAPQEFEPHQFAQTGELDGSVEVMTMTMVANHGVSKENVRTCATCHSPQGDFDFAGLGFEQPLGGGGTAEEAETE